MITRLETSTFAVNTYSADNTTALLSHFTPNHNPISCKGLRQKISHAMRSNPE